MTWAAAFRQTEHPRQPCHRKPDGRRIVPIFKHHHEETSASDLGLRRNVTHLEDASHSFWPGRRLALFAHGSAEHFLPHSVTAGMKRGNNPNWQDKLLGGAILTGFVVVAVIAVVFTVVTWTSGRHKASSSTAVHPLMRPDRRLIL